MRSRPGTNVPRHGTTAGITRGPHAERTAGIAAKLARLRQICRLHTPGSELPSEEPHPTAAPVLAELSLGANARGAMVSAAAGGRFARTVRKSRRRSLTWLCSFLSGRLVGVPGTTGDCWFHRVAGARGPAP